MKPMNRFRLSTRGRADLAEVHHYIAKDNLPAADQFINGLFELFQLLADNPMIGQERNDLRSKLRSMTHGRYVVFYYPGSDGVDIAGVVHGARDVESLFHSGERWSLPDFLSVLLSRMNHRPHDNTSRNSD